jgi:hypothetical protein
MYPHHINHLHVRLLTDIAMESILIVVARKDGSLVKGSAARYSRSLSSLPIWSITRMKPPTSPFPSKSASAMTYGMVAHTYPSIFHR